MGVQLRSELRRLCVETGWCYAVFWRLVHAGGQVHLEWGDGHYERMSGTSNISGFEAMDMLLREKAGCEGNRVDELGFLAENGLATLVEKTMVSQIHAVGVGMVGQVFASGSHQWIIKDNLIDCVSACKVWPELNQQFLSGIQTTAIIPVLPHGVVQLGSTKMVMEDIGFINHVKKLFAQLICEMRIQKLQIEGSAVIPVGHSVDILPSCDRIKGMDYHQSINPESSNIPSWVISNLVHHSNQVRSGIMKAEVRPDNTDFGSTQNKWQYSSPGEYLSANSASCPDNLTFLERQLSSISCQGPQHSDMKNGVTIRDRSDFKLKSSEYHFHQPLQNKNGVLGHMELANGSEIFLSHSGGTVRINDCSGSASNAMFHSVSSKLLPSSSGPSYISGIGKMSENIFDAGKGKSENYLVEDLDVPCLEHLKHDSCPESLLGKVQDFSLNIPNHDPENRGNRGATSVDNVSSTNNGAAGSVSMPALYEAKVPEAAQKNNVLDMVELHNKLGQHGSLNNVIGHCSELNDSELHARVSSSTSQKDGFLPVDPSFDIITSRGLFEVASSDQLLDAVISKFWPADSQNKNKDILCGNLEANQSGKSHHPSYLPNEILCMSQDLPAMFLDVCPNASESKQENSDPFANTLDTFTGYSEPIMGYRSGASHSTESGLQIEGSISTGKCKSTGELGKMTRKRSRPGENPKPRPKDRQLIQDRIKELRGIVPDGGKCSIDALLDKTIKHMLFLQSVTKYADQLKGTAEPRITSKDGGLLLQDNFEGGATWAFEVGSQAVMCPIIVEDLNKPRQMLVEMLCEGRGLFIEIADFIRGLGLTILKGVIEARNAKVWARFAVEANRDVTRMEIFLSLVHLLEPTMGSNTPQGVNISSLPHKAPHSSGLLDCVL